MTGHQRFSRAIVAAATALLVPVAALAQTADPSLSCVPDAVTAGGSMTCTVTDVAASRAISLELRSDGVVVVAADGIAGTGGSAIVTLNVPATSPTGALRVALVGTSIVAEVTVAPARPSGVAAGFGPSTGDVVRTLPAAMVLAMVIVLASGAVPGLRRRRGADAA